MQIRTVRASLATLLVLIAGCTTTQPSDPTSPPSELLGQDVTVCGSLESNHIKDERSGVEFVLDDRLGLTWRKSGRFCVSGVITYRGCRTDPKILCNDAAADFGIRVRAARAL